MKKKIKSNKKEHLISNVSSANHLSNKREVKEKLNDGILVYTGALPL